MSRAARARSGGCPSPITVRGLPAAGILDRCTATKTCPKIIEHFGSAEVWGLKLTPEWVGTGGRRRHSAARQRAPLLHPEHAARRRHRRVRHVRLKAAGVPEHRLSARACCRKPGAAHADGQRDPRPFPQLGA